MENPVAEIAARADALYAARHEIQNIASSVELMQSALAHGFDYELAWRMGRALFFLGQEAKDKVEASAFHARAAKICERASIEEPSRVEGYFWAGVNLALLAALERPLKALRHALAARRTLRRAITIDASYHAAGPLRVLARLEAKLPVFLGGGHTRARANFEKAVSLAPSNTVTRLYLAELLLETGDVQSAERQLRAILNAPQDPAWVFETARDRRLARAMLNKSLKS